MTSTVLFPLKKENLVNSVVGMKEEDDHFQIG